MSYGLTPPDWVDNSWSTSGAGGSDIATQTADNSTGVDGWGGFFQNLTATAFSYALQKDASKSQVTAQPAQQPIYVQAPASASASLNIPPALLVVGLGVLAYVALSK